LWTAVVRFGFSETPDVPKALDSLGIPGFKNDPMAVTYFLGRDEVAISPSPTGMARWRRRLFIFMFKNAVSPTDFFRLPPIASSRSARKWSCKSPSPPSGGLGAGYAQSPILTGWGMVCKSEKVCCFAH
jgi:hypothetical protein